MKIEATEEVTADSETRRRTKGRTESTKVKVSAFFPSKYD
jgi:hypothetical protein